MSFCEWQCHTEDDPLPLWAHSHISDVQRPCLGERHQDFELDGKQRGAIRSISVTGASLPAWLPLLAPFPLVVGQVCSEERDLLGPWLSCC